MDWLKDERLARLALQMAYEPGNCPALHAMIATEGVTITAAALAAVRDPAGEQLRTANPEGVMLRGLERGLRYVTPLDEEWPEQLDALALAPPVGMIGEVPLGLWVKGPLRLDQLADSVAVVGSRAATTYGTSVAGTMSAWIAGHDRTVVSGAAFGIDDAAHRGALAVNGPTVAVLACGADQVYPMAHRRLIEQIAETGAVVSEQPPGATVTRARFLSRNRIVAALAEGTVVVESAARSGSLATAEWARRIARPVMAVPGPVTSVASEGTHALIQSGAHLVTSGADVLDWLFQGGSVTPLEAFAQGVTD